MLSKCAVHNPRDIVYNRTNQPSCAQYLYILLYNTYRDGSVPVLVYTYANSSSFNKI